MLCIAGVAADASTRGDLHLADGNLGQDRNFARIPQPPAILVEDGKSAARSPERSDQDWL